MISKGIIDKDRLILSAIIFILLLGGFYVFGIHVINQPYLQLDKLIILLIYIGIAAYFTVKGIKELRTVDVYRDKIKIRCLSIFTTTIPYSYITSFNTFIDEQNHFLHLRTRKKSFLLNRNFLSNSKELLEQFNHFSHIRNQQYNKDTYRKRENRKLISWSVTGVLLVIMAAFTFFHKPSLLDRNALISVKGRLKDRFDINRPKLRNPGHSIAFTITNHNKFIFHIESPGYNNTDLDKLERFESLDAVEMLIKKSDNAIKLQRIQAPNFLEKHFRWQNIEVYALRVNNINIFTLEEYNKTLVKSGENNYVWALFLGFTGFEVLRRTKNAYRKRSLSTNI